MTNQNDFENFENFSFVEGDKVAVAHWVDKESNKYVFNMDTKEFQEFRPKFSSRVNKYGMFSEAYDAPVNFPTLSILEKKRLRRRGSTPIKVYDSLRYSVGKYGDIFYVDNNNKLQTHVINVSTEGSNRGERWVMCPATGKMIKKWGQHFDLLQNIGFVYISNSSEFQAQPTLAEKVRDPETGEIIERESERFESLLSNEYFYTQDRKGRPIVHKMKIKEIASYDPGFYKYHRDINAPLIKSNNPDEVIVQLKTLTDKKGLTMHEHVSKIYEEWRHMKLHATITVHFTDQNNVKQTVQMSSKKFRTPKPLSMARKNDLGKEIAAIVQATMTEDNQHVAMQREAHSSFENDMQVAAITFHCDRYVPFLAGDPIPIPEFIKNSNNYINPKTSKLQDCFRIAILAALHPNIKDAGRTCTYYTIKTQGRGKSATKCIEWKTQATFTDSEDKKNVCFKNVDFTSITFPTPVDENEFETFETNNPTISLTVYIIKGELNDSGSIDFNEDGMDIFYDTRNDTDKVLSKISLLALMFEVEDEQNGLRAQSHFLTVRDVNAMHNTATKDTHRRFFCKGCLKTFYAQESFNHHKAAHKCNTFEQMHRIPSKNDSEVTFKSYHANTHPGCMIYADCEAYVNHYVSNLTEFLREHPEIDNQQIQFQILREREDEDIEHVPFVVGTKAVASKIKNFPYGAYTEFWGDNCFKKFIDHVISISQYLKSLQPQPIHMDDTQVEHHQSQTLCQICHVKFSTDENQRSEWKVKHHDHFTGDYICALCSACNLKIHSNMKKVVVVFHNLKGYDGHFLMKTMKHFNDKFNINTISQNSQKFTCLKLGDNITFIDSAQFLSGSLEKLAKQLQGNHPILDSEIRDEVLIKMLAEKGVYPYSYITPQNLKETQLPSIEAFANDLTSEPCSQSEYQRALDIWKVGKCSTLKQYTSLYLKSDTLLLADIFQNFADTALNTYGISPAHFVSLPQYSWQSMLKHFGKSIECFTDYDMLHFLDGGNLHIPSDDHSSKYTSCFCSKNILGCLPPGVRAIRGGMTNAYKRYAKSDENTHIMYIDANNLYGWAMSQPLPVGNYEWVESIDLQTILDTPSDSPIGYLVEIDTRPLSRDLQDKFSDMPFLPVFDYPIASDVMGGKKSKSQKLLQTLHPVKNYVVHYEMLKLIIKHGIEIERIDRVIKFDQSPWMKRYIELNSNLRKNTSDELQRDLFKLMNNAVFGKTMENVRYHTDIKLLTTEEQLRNSIAKTNHKSIHFIDNNLYLAEFQPRTVKFNKPIAVGFAILELSKVHMYRSYYEHLKPKWGNNMNMIFMDTDSFCFEVITNNLPQDLLDLHEIFDFSNYPDNNPLKTKTHDNKGVVGKFKDEMAGERILEIAVVSPKQYSILTDSLNLKKNKGIPKSVVTQQLKHEMYVNNVLHGTPFTANFKRIQSKDHTLFTTTLNKRAISDGYDKRIVLTDRIHTLPHGHYKIIHE